MSRAMPLSDPSWCGYTRDLSMIPLEQIRKDGYDVVEKEDKLGKYFEIVRIKINQVTDERN